MSQTKKPLDSQATLTRSGTGWYFLNFPPEIGELFETGSPTRRVVCTLNESHTYQCALMPNKGVFSIGVSKVIREKLGLAEGDLVKVRLEQDTSTYGAPMPEEFQEVLNQDDEGDRLFHALTAGKQRSLIYLIGGVKNIDKRIHLALTVLEHLKKNDGNVVGDKLHEEMKRPIANPESPESYW